MLVFNKTPSHGMAAVKHDSLEIYFLLLLFINKLQSYMMTGLGVGGGGLGEQFFKLVSYNTFFFSISAK